MKSAALVLLLTPFAAFVAASAARAQAVTTDVITITATKRPERITDVPAAITAIGANEIRDRGASDLRDLQYSVPGLNIQEQAPGANRIQLRGVNAGAGTGLPIVGTYVDEVGITIDQQQRDGPFPLVDLARIEVLRGPQGTLYGEGSLAGTIRYITRNPSLTRTDGFIEANAYRQGEGGTGYRVNGAVGVPLMTDKVGLRVAGGYDKTAGWIDYPQINASDVNSSKRWFIRPKLFAQVTDKLTVSLMLQRYVYEGDSDNLSSAADPMVRQRNERFPGSDKSDLANAVVQYDFGPVTLTSSTGYQKRDLLFNASLAGFRVVFDTAFKQWSQEVRIASNGDGPLRYSAGIWMRDFKSEIDRTAFRGGAVTTALRRVGDDPVDSTSSAVFGDATWKLNDRIEISGGGRWFNDERSTGSTVPAVATTSAKFDAFSPRLSGRYEWNRNASTYATVAKGFRSGGFNGSRTTFGPETLWNYELGHKASLLGGNVFFDGAVYYADYKDRQAQSAAEVSPGVFAAETRNVGKASGPGVEAGLSARLGAGLELSGTVGWSDIKSKVSNTEVLKGEAFDFVSKVTSSLSLSQRLPVFAGLTGMWRVDYQHADPYTQRVRQQLPTGAVSTLQDFRSQNQDYFNVRAGVEAKGWSLMLDVKNLFDKRPLLFPVAPISASGEGGHAAPRPIGLTLRSTFGGT
jgi:outer membrane receptor protein involved in Fe transport